MDETGHVMVDIAIVIVNYNTCALLRNCLASLDKTQGALTYHVIVVDNASPDESVAMVQQEFPHVTLIANRTNEGFAWANNRGLERAGFAPDGRPLPHAPRYALLLNPDTVLPSSTLADIVAFMDAHPQAGAVGPKLVMVDGSLDLACRRSFPTPEVSFYRMVGLSKLFPRHPRFGRYNMTFIDPDEFIEVDAVVGAFMAVRREAIAQAGLLDETYFMYGEDLDWAYQIRAHGWPIYYNPAIQVTHVKRAASRYSAKAQLEFFRAMEIFYQKYYAAHTPFWLNGLVLAGIHLKWQWAKFRYRNK